MWLFPWRLRPPSLRVRTKQRCCVDDVENHQLYLGHSGLCIVMPEPRSSRRGRAVQYYLIHAHLAHIPVFYLQSDVYCVIRASGLACYFWRLLTPVRDASLSGRPDSCGFEAQYIDLQLDASPNIDHIKCKRGARSSLLAYAPFSLRFAAWNFTHGAILVVT